MATAIRSETREVRSESDIVGVRQRVRSLAVELGFSLVDQTKLVTATSEIARNTVVYGGGGAVTLAEVQNDDGRAGLRLVFADQGPGIADLDQAMRDGYTTGSGLGLGLGGARRLVSEFEIHSRAGEGTRVTIVKWK